MASWYWNGVLTGLGLPEERMNVGKNVGDLAIEIEQAALMALGMVAAGLETQDGTRRPRRRRDTRRSAPRPGSFTGVTGLAP